MPQRAKLLEELRRENDYGVFLMVQMDGVPETLQLVIATTELDEKAGGLRDRGQYVIRALGVKEHKISVGMFGSLRFVDDHPLLYQYNKTPIAVFFRGKCKDPNALIVDILQAYASTFGPWRQIPEYLNQEIPLFNLLSSEGGLLGQMPQPLAINIEKVLTNHDLEVKLIEGEPPETRDEHGRSQLRKSLIIDDSYIVAMDFTVDILGKI